MQPKRLTLSTDDLRRILAGKKTQTRRIAPHGAGVNAAMAPERQYPYGNIGDIVWIAEELYLKGSEWRYSVDDAPVMLDSRSGRITEMFSWAHHKEADQCPANHMPRWASRLYFELTGARIEPLNNVSVEDARREGFESVPAFRANWNKTQRIHWRRNPYVWVLSFKKVENLDAPK